MKINKDIEPNSRTFFVLGPAVLEKSQGGELYYGQRYVESVSVRSWTEEVLGVVLMLMVNLSDRQLVYPLSKSVPYAVDEKKQEVIFASSGQRYRIRRLVPADALWLLGTREEIARLFDSLEEDNG